MRRTPRLSPACALLALTALASCGDDAPERRPDGAAVAAGPANDVRARSETAAAGPDEAVAQASLVLLRESLLSGGASRGEAWGRDVLGSGSTLWPGDDAESRAARSTHATLAHVAGDVAREIAGDRAARTSLAEQDAVSLAIHDALARATEGSTTEYRAWVVGEGRALVSRLEDDRRRRFTPPR